MEIEQEEIELPILENFKNILDRNSTDPKIFSIKQEFVNYENLVQGKLKKFETVSSLVIDAYYTDIISKVDLCAEEKNVDSK